MVVWYYFNVAVNLLSILVWLAVLVFSGITWSYLGNARTTFPKYVLAYALMIGVYYIYLIIFWLLKDYDVLMPNHVVNLMWSVFHLLIPSGVLFLVIHLKRKYSIISYKLQKDVERYTKNT